MGKITFLYPKWKISANPLSMRLCRYFGYFPKISIIQNGMSNLLHIFPFGIQLSEKCIPVLMLVIRKPILVTHFGSQILKYPKWSDFKK